MIPIKDDNPTLGRPYVTWILVAGNVLAWIFVQGLGTNPSLAASICEFGVVFGELSGNVPAGTRIPLTDNLVCVVEAAPKWHTVFTSMFMHGGWLHLIGNMWFLYIFGDNVEDAMGPFRFFVFYILCGVCAVLAQGLSNPSAAAPMVGASGAIGGVMGAYAILYPRSPVHVLVFFGFFFTRVILPAFFMLAFWFLLQMLGGLFGSGSGGVAFWAHIGGFLGGIMLLRPFCLTGRREQCRLGRKTTKKYFQSHESWRNHY